MNTETRTVYRPCEHGKTYKHLIVLPLWLRLRGGYDRLDLSEYEWEDDNHCGGGHSDIEYLIQFGNITFWMTVPGISVSTSGYAMQGWDMMPTIRSVDSEEQN